MKELTLQARTENVTELTAFIDGCLEEAGCPVKTQMQIDVAVDELFSNIALYAYPSGAGEATVQFEHEGDTVRLTFIDSGVPYDPLSAKEPDVSLSAAERGIGGLGIFLVRKFMDGMRYERRDGQNILQISKKMR